MPTPPSTLSDGKLILNYTHLTDLHSASFNLVSGAMPASQVDAETIARRVAVAWGLILSNGQTIPTWAIRNQAGDEMFSGAFDPVVPVPDVWNDSGYRSPTVCFGGRGIAGAPGESRGQTRVFCFNGQMPASASKRIVLGSNPRYAAFAAFLNADPDVWADYYGQKAVCRGYVTVQFNARAQRVLGS